MLTIEEKADILDRILELLKENMNLEQVCYCYECHFWGTSGERSEGRPVYSDYLRHCRKYGQEKIDLDYCSDGVKPCKNSI